MSLEMLKNRFTYRVFAQKKKNIRTALDCAYADMSRRQNGHTPELKEACIDYLETVFSSPLKIDDFDNWHKNLTHELISKWNAQVADFGTVGKAQKVINMAFKYLSCIPNDFDGILPNCHMTLDSYTLEWYEIKVKPWAKSQKKPVGKKVSAWSKITSYEEYLTIQNNIRDYLATNANYSILIGGKSTPEIKLPVAPMKAEFIVWEGQIVERKYNGLIKLLDNYAKEKQELPSGQGYDDWLINTLFQDYLKDYINKF